MEAYESLEQEFSQWEGCKMPYCVAVASGTAALHLALEVMQLPRGSEVLVPDYTMIACPRAVTMARLEPVFVDCGEDLLIDRKMARKKLTRQTKIIMPVHIYGRRCNMDDVDSIASDRNLAIVEDMSEIHGVVPHETTEAACWSFYKNKVVYGEEGGMIGFRSEAHADRARRLRSLGFTDAHDFTHVPHGINARMSNAHATLIRHSLMYFDVNLVDRRMIEATYNDAVPEEWHMPARSIPWVYDLRIKGMTTEAQSTIVKSLNSDGIAARHGFKPMTSQEEYLHFGCCNAKRLASEIIYLPINPLMTQRKVLEIVEQLKQAVGLTVAQ